MPVTLGRAFRCVYRLHRVRTWIAVSSPARDSDVRPHFVNVSCWLALVQDLAVSRSLVQGVLPNRSAVQIRTSEKKSHMKDDGNVSCATFNWLLSDENDREERPLLRLICEVLYSMHCYWLTGEGSCLTFTSFSGFLKGKF
jgi:hypothetical protein